MSGKLRQLHAAVASGFGSFMLGSTCVWPSYTAPLYKSNSTPLTSEITLVEESLLGSLPTLGVMLGVAIAVYLIDTLGRRNSGVLLSLIYVTAWAIKSVSSSLSAVLTARSLSGVPGGGLSILAPIFISEVAEDSIRGTLASAAMFFYCLGVFVSYILGWLFKYQTIIWLQIVFSIFCTILIVMVVESPVYLLRKNRDMEARISIAKYRGTSVSSKIVTYEFLRLKQQVRPTIEPILETGSPPYAGKNENEVSSVVQDNMQSRSPIKILVSSPHFRRSFLILCASITLHVIMGMLPVQVYAKTVFLETSPDRADMYTVLLALFVFLGCAVATFISDRAGRRILLITSSLFACACLTALGFLAGNNAYPAWLPVLLILLFCFTFMFGVGTIPFVLMAELFTPEVQNIASICVIELLWFLNFFLVGVFPYMLDFCGMRGVFFIFAFTSICNAVFSYFMIPETKGLSIEQIQNLLRDRKNYFRNSQNPALS